MGTDPVNAQVIERVRILAVAGIAVGVIVAGAGGRLAMLVLRLTSPDHVKGLTSDDGFTIGDVTLGGTYSLLVLGAAVGVIGAATYLAVAPWLIGPVWFRRFTLAAASGAVVGAILIHDDGIDFKVLEPTWLAIGLFIALPAAFAASIGIVVDSVSAPDSWTRRGRRRWLLPLVLVAAFPFALFLLGVATIVSSVWMRVRRALPSDLSERIAVSAVIRAAWLGVAFVGLAALVADVRALS